MSEGNGFITREAILAPAKRRFAEIAIRNWGKFRIRSLTELERSRFESSIRDKRGQVIADKMVDLKCRLIVLAVVDHEGNQLLTNQDIEQLRQQDSKLTNELVDFIQRHCGISDVDLEDLEKNSEPTPVAASR
jgi:hypothetical protein